MKGRVEPVAMVAPCWPVLLAGPGARLVALAGEATTMAGSEGTRPATYRALLQALPLTFIHYSTVMAPFMRKGNVSHEQKLPSIITNNTIKKY